LPRNFDLSTPDARFLGSLPEVDVLIPTTDTEAMPSCPNNQASGIQQANHYT